MQRTVATDAATGQLRVGLLGPPVVWRDRELIEVSSRPQATLLSILALHPGRPHSRDELIERVWQGNPPPSAASALRLHLARIRSNFATGPKNPIEHTPAGYVLDPAIATDLDALDTLLSRLTRPGSTADRKALYGRALAMWRGAPFRDAQDEGLRLEADRLTEVQLSLEEGLVQTRLEAGEHAELCTDLARLVDAAPLRERRSCQLMIAQYRSGRQADALATFRRLRDHLLDELGVEPGPEAKRLEVAILRQDASLMWRGDDDAGAEEPYVIPPRTCGKRPPSTPAMLHVVAGRLQAIDDTCRNLVIALSVLDQPAAADLLSEVLDLSPATWPGSPTAQSRAA